MNNVSHACLRVLTVLPMLLAALTVTPAAAAPFRVDWTAKVGTVTGPVRTGVTVETYLSAGHTITASGVFDDTSAVMHAYFPPGTVIETRDVADYPGVFDIFADVTYDFSANLQGLIGATDQTYVPIYLSQYSHDIVTGPGIGAHFLQFRDPGIEIVFSGNPGATNNWGYIHWTIGDAISPTGEAPFYGFNLTNVTLSITALDMAPVPEPVSLLLFASGLAGLAGIRMKKRR